MSTKRIEAVSAHTHQHMPKYDHGSCVHCRGDVDQKNFCWGCERYVCTGCEKFSPEGPHRPEDHVHARPVVVTERVRRFA